jgi:hypothetical protein
LEQQSVNATTTGTTNVSSASAFSTIINTPTAAGRIFVLPALGGLAGNIWFAFCNKSLTQTIAIQSPAGTTIYTIPVSPAGGMGSYVKLAVLANASAYYRAG